MHSKALWKGILRVLPPTHLTSSHYEKKSKTSAGTLKLSAPLRTRKQRGESGQTRKKMYVNKNYQRVSPLHPTLAAQPKLGLNGTKTLVSSGVLKLKYATKATLLVAQYSCNVYMIACLMKQGKTYSSHFQR